MYICINYVKVKAKPEKRNTIEKKNDVSGMFVKVVYACLFIT